MGEAQIEVYVDVEPHEVRSEYSGELLRTVERGSWCTRYVMEWDGEDSMEV